MKLKLVSFAFNESKWEKTHPNVIFTITTMH